MAKKRNKALRALARDVLRDELHSVLHDISYRLGVLYDAEHGRRVGSRDLNLASHQLDGYTVTDNSPSAGSIAWADLNVVYKGVNYDITDGNTNKKYVWWDFSATPNTTLQFSDTKPVLTDDDVLVFVNNGGIHQTVIGSGRMTSGAAILTGSVDGDAIGNNAITEGKIAALAITTGKLASGAVTGTKLGSGAVTADKIGAGAVATDKLNTAIHMIF